MAKVTLKNTREHAIHLNLPNKTEKVIVPGAKQDPEDRSKVIHGVVEVDDSFVSEVKKHPVAKLYFDEGWLRVNEPAPKKAQQ